MKVLLDHCVPKRFGKLLVGHFVRTSAFMGWAQLKSGGLLAVAAREYDVLITIDKGMRFQLHAPDLPMPVLSLDAVTNQPHVLAPFAPVVMRLLGTALQKRVYIVEAPPPVGRS